MGRYHRPERQPILPRLARRSANSDPSSISSIGMRYVMQTFRLPHNTQRMSASPPFVLTPPNISGHNTLYPGHAEFPCLGIATDSDSASHAKQHLREAYQRLGLPFRCHTCGVRLDGGRWVNGHFLETSWIGDHQPPTSAWWWPQKMQYIQSITPFVYVVESQDLMYQTRYPVRYPLHGLFQYCHSHRYPLYVNVSGQMRPQRYIYPQCEACSRRQSHSL